MVALAAAATGFPIARRTRSRLLHLRHRKGPPDPSPLDRAIADNAALLAGALFGHSLRDQELSDVRRNVEFVAQVDGGWRSDFAMIAAYVDALAHSYGAVSFGGASDDVRERIVDDIMRPPIDSRRSELAALISARERTRRFLRSDAIPLLAHAYSSSGAAWRRRGYARWPGIPGDPREYTRPGSRYQC
jgi:hypothetical protein